MRVVLGTVYPYDESRVRGGVEAVALNLGSALAKRDDLELHIVSCNRTLKRNLTEQRGSVTFHWLATGRHLYGLRAATVDAWRVRKVYEQISPDVIHAQGCSEYAIAASAKIPLVLTIHGLHLFVPVMLETAHYRGPVGIYRRWIEGWIVRQSVRRAQAVISIAGDYVPSVMGEIMNGKPVYEIANPIDVDVWDTVPRGYDSGDQILCVGEIIERKNAFGLVRAFAEVTRLWPKAKLHLAGGIGEPDYFTRVQGEVARLGLQNKVAFLGRLNQNQLLEAYARSSLVVLTSIQETAPMALAQAMAAGKPVVATRVAGIPWMIEDGVMGYLVDVGDMQGMADHIIELLQDKTKRERMGQASREAARLRFAADRVADMTVQVYRGLLV